MATGPRSQRSGARHSVRARRHNQTRMQQRHTTIAIEPLAPPKPAWGAPCNGCGVCCLAQPCPIGIVLSGRRHGACVAVRWNPQLAMYRCGAIAEPDQVLASRLPRVLLPLAAPLAPVLRGLARRSIAMDAGCDCDLEVQRPGAPPDA